MAVSHVKSNTIPDFTGTVTVFNSLGATQTANATDLIRPSDWNSAHNQYITLSGNTAGASTMSGSNIVFQGGNSVTLSANGASLVISGPTQSAFVLSNSNGLTFGTNGSTVTASHNGLTSQSNQAVSAANGSFAFQTLTLADSNGVSFSTGTQGLFATVATTYAASNHSHGNPTLALTNLSGTTASASNGLTLSLSAAAPGAVTLTNYATGNTTQSSSGTIAGSSVIVRGSGGVSAGISNGSYVIEGPALTSLSATGALSASSNGSTISLGVGTVTVSATGNTTQASSGTVNLNALVIQGTGGASVGVSNGSIVISGGAGGGGGGVGLSAGTQSVSTGTVVFSNSNGITFGMSGSSQVTASYNSTQFAGTGTTFAGANISASMTLNSNGLNLSASVAAPGAAAENNAINLLGANTSGNTTATGSTIGWSGVNLTLSGTNGSQVVVSAPATSSLSATGAVSLSTNGSTISIGVGTVTVSATSNTTQNSSGTVNLNALVLQGAGVASVGLSNGSVVISVPSGGGAGDGVNILAAGTQTAATTGTVLFNNSNGISFGMSNSSVITASYTVPSTAGLISAVNVSAGTTSNNLSALTFANSNGLTFGLNASTITASHNGITQQSTQPVAVSGQNGSYAFSTLSLSNANGISFGTSAGSAITASHNALTTARASTDAIGLNTAQTNVTWTVNSSGLSLNAAGYAGTATAITGGAAITLNSAGLSFNGAALAGTGTTFNGTNASASMTLNTAGLRLDLSAGGGGGGMGISAGTQSVSTGTMIFANSNGLTFGMSGSSQITASYNSTQFAGTGTTFAGANISASMTLNSAGLNLSASVAAPGAAAENNAHNLLGANTAGNTTATGSTIGLSGLNLTLSGTNASQIVISAPATSSLVGTSGMSVSTNGSTISIINTRYMENFRAIEKGNNTTYSSLGQNTLQFQHFYPEDVIQFSYVELWARGTLASSSNSQVYAQTISYGIYSQDTGTNNTRMTLAGSSSMSMNVSFNSNTAAGFTVGNGATSFTTTSGGTGILANISGPFHLYMPFTSTLQPNVKHALAIHVSSATTVGTQAWRFAPLVQTVMNSLSMGRIYVSATSATATSVIGDREMGVYTATTGAMPASYATSQISIAVSRQQLPFMLEV